ncbi:hypothetical protein R4R92_004624 [Citrobacter freundii]|uniref:hypothetical protein n=1 Tax=Citrobacter freundii TaxID=546 RepID=UPI0028D96B2A|nr:hypothetical protein [Citrobacter freundii]ELR9594089.1 hypothetical protein [Citrobacter freundii]HEH9868107.1 hypothetical protein [Citrobacter freundii]
MRKIIKGMLVVSLFATATSAFAVGDPDANFSKTDCNSPKVRAMLIESYNAVLKDQNAEFTVIDAYDQKRVKGGLNNLTCHGTYEFSDGDKLTVTYKLYKNSLGQFINSFEPDEE